MSLILSQIINGLAKTQTQGESAIPGQGAIDMSQLLGDMQQPASANGSVINLGQTQQAANQWGQPFDGGVLPPAYGDVPPGAMQDPTTWQAPSGGQQGGQSFSMPPMQSQPVGLSPNGQQAQPAAPVNWGQMLNPIGGDLNHPNSLVRASAGYEKGGLVGALGYLFSNMDKQPQQPGQ